MKFTVFGATGFIGSYLVSFLSSLNHEVYAPARGESIETKYLGHVIYCIGMTSDFRKKPFETIDAHVCKLKDILRDYEFDSFVYLSSTRIYIHNNETVNENSMIPVSPADPFDLFNTSKLTGELLTLNCGKSNVKVARISNVYGNDFASENFVTSIIKDALNNGKIVLRTTQDSAKDYISIDDVVRGLYLISTKGNQGVYNLASGLNVKNESILNIIKEETGCVIEYSPISEQIIFPEISVEKIKRDLNFSISSTLTDNLKGIIKNIKENLIS